MKNSSGNTNARLFYVFACLATITASFILYLSFAFRPVVSPDFALNNSESKFIREFILPIIFNFLWGACFLLVLTWLIRIATGASKKIWLKTYCIQTLLLTFELAWLLKIYLRSNGY
jgi:hypothetical protein